MALTDHRQAFLKHVLLGEIELQAQLAAKAAERLVTEEADFDAIELWSAIQSILTAAANVSRILSPPRPESKTRGAMLRDLLQIDASNPLLQRKLRNHFEHYDERIEEWFSSMTRSTYVDQIIGPLPGFLRDFPQNAHRQYDPATQTLTFRGDSLNLRSILEALEEIRGRVRSVVWP